MAARAKRAKPGKSRRGGKSDTVRDELILKVVGDSHLITLIVRNLTAYPRLEETADTRDAGGAVRKMGKVDWKAVCKVRTTAKIISASFPKFAAALQAKHTLGSGRLADQLFSGGRVPKPRGKDARDIITEEPLCPVCCAVLVPTGWYGDDEKSTAEAFDALLKSWRLQDLDDADEDDGEDDGADEDTDEMRAKREFLTSAPGRNAPGALLRAPFEYDHDMLNEIWTRKERRGGNRINCIHTSDLLPGATLACPTGCYSLDVMQCTECFRWSEQLGVGCNFKYCGNSGGNYAERSHCAHRQCTPCSGGAATCDTCGRTACGCRFLNCVHPGCDAALCRVKSDHAYNMEDEMGDAAPCAFVDYATQPEYDSDDDNNDAFYEWQAQDHAYCKRHAPKGAKPYDEDTWH